ncbi:hypothetical protein J6TS1_50790 [Siminovitchia terrae]|uniref:DUF2508 family protein n=1 Tax=Siminovitchia terrae TaxID=1914933 RepID=A0A429X2V9_SIMTE|nr:YaaL family protein [Siminovitchia terrae]RST57704.1 DUF2508 family protein [Siminovitchia terrae]GIN93481.1 hypothetical protein J22TS1_45320 [Siminovitchia terrae]GIN99209.1 hypothetical protein J6TS1_50790 [Siminovitchia terrae]
MFRKQKMRKEFDHRLIDLMGIIKKQWDQKSDMCRLSYEENDELQYQMRLAKAKYIFLFQEAKKRKISIKDQ